MPVVVSSLLHSATWELIWTAARSATWVPNARTEWPDHSCCIGNFTFNQNHPTRSVKSWILCTKDRFQEKLLEKAYFTGYRSPDKSGRIWPIYLRIKATGLDCPITAVISLISAVWCVWYFTANSILIFFRLSRLGGWEVTTRNRSTQCLLFAGYVIWWIFTSDQAFFFCWWKGNHSLTTGTQRTADLVLKWSAPQSQFLATLAPEVLFPWNPG